jgi:hypothetical protein
VKQGYVGTIVPEVLFYYRRRAGSMSSICCSGEPHQRLTRYLVEKHHDSYDRHLLEVLLRKERETGELLRANRETERHIQTWLMPEVERRREELDGLNRKLRQAESERRLHTDHERLVARVAELEHTIRTEREQLSAVSSELARAFHEVATLRTSTSWKVTAPQRAVYDLLLRLTAGLQ